MLHDTTLRGTGLAITPHLYAPERDFDPAAVALKFTRQVRHENAARGLGWSLADYRDITVQLLDIATEEADVAGHA
ncbi:hypothetical protein [Acuticoccus sediminis]|uniref:hypothetical protein n=1 Tax=Acuticoccus sediminis TaxID=2184697 RepID=UPI001CFCED79|nr:hypothetical protein [Acuticoccus sediminis]